MATSVSTHSWSGPGVAGPISYSVTTNGDLLIIDVDMTDDDEKDVEISWLSTFVNVIFIYTPFAARLRFNYNGTPQDFDTVEGGVFHWDYSGGISCPVTGNVSNLRITRLNPSDGTSDDDIVQIRVNKDATP